MIFVVTPLKDGLCNIVCPISGDEQCKKDHCDQDKEEDNDVQVQPRASKQAFDVPEKASKSNDE